MDGWSVILHTPILARWVCSNWAVPNEVTYLHVSELLMAGPLHVLVKTALGPQVISGELFLTLSTCEYSAGKLSIGQPVP